MSDEGIEDGVARYVREMDAVPGWLGHQDVVMFERIGLIQQGSWMRGDILEIGTYMGKSAILLGFLLGDYDSLVINDLFDGSASTADNVAEVTQEYPGLTQKAFIDRYMAYHQWKPEVVADLSSTLPKALGDRKFRLIHVDGSHTYEVVREDILNSRDFAGPDCIVVMDDWRTVHTPGVSAAVWEAVTREGLIPLVVTDQKFYAMWEAGPIGIGGYFQEWVRENYPDQHQSHWVAGHELLRIGTPPQPV